MREILKRNVTTILSVLLNAFVFFSEAAGHGMRRGGKRTLPLLCITILIFLLNELTWRIMKAKREDRAFRRTTGILLWAAAVPVVLLVTQQIVKYGGQLLPEYIWYNLVLLSLLLILVTLVVGNFRRAVIIYSVSLIVLALVCYYVQQFRGKPLTVFDILGVRTAADVASGYVIRLKAKPGLCLQGLLVFLTLQIRMQTLRLSKAAKIRMFRLAAACLTACALWLFCSRCLWNINWMVGADDYELTNTYASKGFFPKFISSIGYLRIDEPAGYSVEAAGEIADRLADENGKDRSAKAGEAAAVPANIIVVMNESFADMEMFGDIRSDKEILPYFHSLKSGDGIYVQKGRLHVPAFGGGTANTEYEMLTGNSMQFLIYNVVAYEVYCHNPEYGLASTLKDQGYETVAIHPGWNNAWNRKQVFPRMGFDQIIFRRDWGEEYETIRNKVSDREAYGKIRQVYEQKDRDRGLFVFCVTIQNHGGYSPETAEGYEPDVHLQYDEAYPETELYLSLLRESDRALKEDLLDYFAAVDEPTMIVFFGDHQVAPEEDRFYVQELSSGESSPQDRFITPFVIWTNYDPGGRSLELMQREDPEMSANFLGSYALELANLDMAPYNRLLLDLNRQIPVMGMGVDRLPDGTWVDIKEAQAGQAVSPEAAKLLGEYRILQYNNTLDWRSRVDRAFTVQKNDER